MDLIILTVFAAFFVDKSESGGHGKHHDHLKLYIPEFIHHDLHTKVITVHHHHHAPKKQHHHHHHHHHKPHGGHHHHHHHKKTHHTSVSHGSKHHGHGHHHGHHSHKHHGHHHDDVPNIIYDQPTYQNEQPSYQYDQPSYQYDQPQFSIPTDLGSASPRIHGVTHTVKQVKVFDSHPERLPKNFGPGNGYQVTEDANDDDEDEALSTDNNYQQSYPGVFNLVRAAAPEIQNVYQAAIPAPNINQGTHDPFAVSPQFVNNIENSAPSAPSAPSYPSAQNSIQSGFGDSENYYPGNEIGISSLSEDLPVSFSRESGIEQSIKTGGIESVVY